MSKRKFLPITVTHIFVMLGSGCNFHCRYCLQQDTMKGKTLPTVVNEDVIHFIAETAVDNGNSPLTVQFYGGEPLLYFQQLKKIVGFTSYVKNINYRVITNGSLITQEMVDFFNEHNIGVAVSWDGVGTASVRDFDVFQREDTKKLLFGLNHLAVSSVISSEVYPLELLKGVQALSEEYAAARNEDTYISLSVDQIFDSGVEDKSLFNIDYVRVFNEMTDICNRYVLHMKGEKREDGTPWISLAEDFYVSYLRNSVKMNTDPNSYSLKHSICCCGNGYHVLNVDLAGNLYACHNTCEPVGTIYDPYFKYLEEIIRTDTSKENYKVCKDCPVLTICNSGCKLIGQEVRRTTYCNLKIAMFAPFINALIEFNDAFADDATNE